jgi:hypothetical protein
VIVAVVVCHVVTARLAPVTAGSEPHVPAVSDVAAPPPPALTGSPG